MPVLRGLVEFRAECVLVLAVALIAKVVDVLIVVRRKDGPIFTPADQEFKDAPALRAALGVPEW